MARNEQKPDEQVRPAPGGGDERIFTHPAYGQIRASRVSGHANLYDSDFNHQHYITITIARSQLHRSLSRDWHFGRDELIEVSLSEAQWASFVSSMNVGSGVPCTITRHDGKMIPRLPSPENPAHKFKAEIGKAMQDVQGALSKLASDLDGPLSKTKVAELRRQIDMLSGRLTGQTGFVADQFDEHVEQTVERAKTEINAYATALVVRTGIEALQGQSGPVLEYLPAANTEEISNG
ncbi:hypothetical protein E6C67_08540 [Azospirillum sp. TSA2s]|uniref:hypothetical protein n=1 Tax=Azospirillum sp. TSA2s TaxID=709810 RepID=UPI0010AB4169|nr:hypothetical protein [Azospirillum sp. TSA2s]QCG93986.1 hypothetical protein E6C67_08540 [Azospirillum sp. TSA2s]